MRKLTKVLSIILIMVIFTTSAYAFEYEVLDVNDLIESASAWAQPEVEKAKEAGLLTPNTGLFFRNDITRSQFAELVVNMVEKVTGNEIASSDASTFTDTKDINILKAYNVGIVNGGSDTEFAPDNLITREQIASMIYRAITYIEKEQNTEYTVKDENVDGYTDKGDVSSYALQGVGILANNNIMTGTSATTLSPKSSATIEQSILLIYRLYNKINL